MPDGSTLHVNTDTQVTLRYSAAERLLDIDHGQVAVEVVHDRRAFRVHAGSTNAVAVGTKFDVYRRPDSTLITVVSGQVVVSTGTDLPSKLATDGHLVAVSIAAGRQLRVVGDVLPPKSEPADLQESTAWLERKIVFDQRPLAAVADEFNRYNAVPFVVDDPALRRLLISGVFNAEDTESFAAFLASLKGVRVERLPGGFKVSTARALPAPAHRG